MNKLKTPADIFDVKFLNVSNSIAKNDCIVLALDSTAFDRARLIIFCSRVALIMAILSDLDTTISLVTLGDENVNLRRLILSMIARAGRR